MYLSELQFPPLENWDLPLQGCGEGERKRSYTHPTYCPPPRLSSELSQSHFLRALSQRVAGMVGRPTGRETWNITEKQPPWAPGVLSWPGRHPSHLPGYASRLGHGDTREPQARVVHLWPRRQEQTFGSSGLGKGGKLRPEEGGGAIWSQRKGHREGRRSCAKQQHN